MKHIVCDGYGNFIPTPKEVSKNLEYWNAQNQPGTHEYAAGPPPSVWGIELLGPKNRKDWDKYYDRLNQVRTDDFLLKIGKY